MSRRLRDGLEELREHLDVATIMRLIEQTARWVDVETFKLLPVWAPEFARRSQLYKDNWSTPRKNKNRQTGVEVLKLEGNGEANKALTEALGVRQRENWSCCHIWGVDDPTYQLHNAIVQDHRFFSCIGNMVLLPSPLKAFTDTMVDVKAMLRICASNYYHWRCDHASMEEAVATIDAWDQWDAYPSTWPRSLGAKTPTGVIALDESIRNRARVRKQRIAKDLQSAGPHYPRDAVRDALAYWKIDLST